MNAFLVRLLTAIAILTGGASFAGDAAFAQDYGGSDYSQPGAQGGGALPNPNPPTTFNSVPSPPVSAGTPPAANGGVMPPTYSSTEMIQTGNKFFGQISSGLATVVERAFSQYGEPNAYILGSEGSGAFFGGLRYGEGDIYSRQGQPQRIYWQGPSLGFDVGGDGARVMMLVYRLPSLQQLFQRFVGVNGSAYVVGGFGMTVLAAEPTYIVPVKSGLGARLGVNLGYLKFTAEPTWNPF